MYADMNTHSLERLPHAVLERWSRDRKAVKIERLLDNTPDELLMPLRRLFLP